MLHDPEPSYDVPIKQGINGSSSVPNLSPARHIASTTTLQDIHAFQSISESWATMASTPSSVTRGDYKYDLKGIIQKPVEPFGLYIIKDNDGKNMTAVPYHQEMLSNGRKDLGQARLTFFSVDLMNPGPIHPQNFYPGDAICVMRMYVFEEKWMIKNFYLVQRSLIHNCLLTQQSRIGSKLFCIVDGFNVLLAARKWMFRDAGITSKVSFAIGTVFQPELEIAEWGFLPSIVQIHKLEMDPDLLQVSRFILSGVLAMENKNRDLTSYSTKIDAILLTPTCRGIKFPLQKPKGRDLLCFWKRGNTFILRNLDIGISMEMALEVLESSGTSEVIWVSACPLDPNQLPELLDVEVQVFQILEDTKHVLEAFPTDFRAEGTTEKFLEALLGSQMVYWRCPPQFNYFFALVNSSYPVVALNAGPGCGKTSILVSAANQARDGFHVAVAQSSLCVVNMIREHLKFPGCARAVRIVDRNEEAYPTEIDLPTLWPRIFKGYLETVDWDGQDEITRNVLIYLELKSHDPTISLSDLFFHIYKPKIFYGTIDAISQSLHNGTLNPIKDQILTVQFDEANTLSLHEFLQIGARCPNARFGFVGDALQLSPRVSDLPPGLSKIPSFQKDSEFFKKVISRFPCFEQLESRRLAPDVLNCCSALFYKNRLAGSFQSGAHELLAFLKIRSGFGIQVIDFSTLSSYKTIYPLKEAYLAIDLANRIPQNASIGILCFSKKQSNLISMMPELKSFVGTIESAQGISFDVTIILTTGFLDDEKYNEKYERRLNTALSRTNKLCILVTDVGKARSISIWNKLLQKIPKNAIHNLQKLKKSWI